MSLQSIKLKGVGDLENALTRDTKMQFALMVLHIALVHYSLSMFHLLLFGTLMYSLCHCFWKYVILLFYFDFTGVTVKITALSLEETLNFVLLDNAETGRLWRLLKLVWFLHYAMATSL